MLFNIVNPSDPYTIEAPSLDVAAVASILLGQGRYPFDSLDGGENVPLFMFGGADKMDQDTLRYETLMELSNRVMDTKLGEVVECLDSVLYGDRKDRVSFFAETKGMDRPNFEAHRMVRQDSKCSSMNDIGERAYRMAAKLRKSIEDGIKEPPLAIGGINGEVSS